MAPRVGQHMALIAGEAERLARGTIHFRIALRVERLLCVFTEVRDQKLRLLGARRLHPRHHFRHQRPEVPPALHAQHHALDHAGPFRRMVHRGIGQVVALHAVAQRELRAARSGLGELSRLESRGQDALEERPVRVLRPALPGLRDFIRPGGKRHKHQR